MSFDYDFVIVGSGFGGSVSALRLAEKGYSVAVLEMGKRWTKDTFPKSNWNLPKSVWFPKLLCHGIFNLTVLKDVFILSGTGVGGGSLVYACTLLVPPDAVWDDPRWRAMGDWKTLLAPHYETAKRMLGVARNPRHTPADDAVLTHAKRLGTEATFHLTDVGVYFGKPGETVPDPFFGGEGPARTGCIFCGGCMVGCRHGAKNTLDYNYLWLAEKKGVTVIPERRATDVRALDGGGYEIAVERSTSVLFKERRTLRARGVVLSAGVLGSVPLLLACKERGSLPKISDALGGYVRTNSEAILGVRTKRDDLSEGIAITSGVKLDAHTSLEPVRYPKGSGMISLLTTPLTDGGGTLPRVVRWMGVVLRNPWQLVKARWPFRFAEQTVILLVMQTLDNFLRVKLARPWYWPFEKTLTTVREANAPAIPTYLPVANDAARAIAKDLDGIAMSSITEVLLDVPTTAHILGGCPMGADREHGAIDAKNRVFGYDDLYVIDGSMIGANLGVNPSLTITALAEHAMSHVPDRAAREDWGRVPG